MNRRDERELRLQREADAEMARWASCRPVEPDPEFAGYPLPVGAYRDEEAWERTWRLSEEEERGRLDG